MIGPTGCGKTEIARRLAKLSAAPFIKVEATKYTEVGYVGRDVESMIRDLVVNSASLVRKEAELAVRETAEKNAEERILDLLLPSASPAPSDTPEDAERKNQARSLMRHKLAAREMEDKETEVEIQGGRPVVQVLSGPNMEDLDMQMQNMLGDLIPRKSKKRKVPVSEARRILIQEETDRLLDEDKIQTEAVRRAEQMGIVFIDEIDKVCGRGGGSGSPDVSREGVQRDLLPIVEGATVNTRSGPVKTDHILFIAAGAFHSSRPSDLIPELQGRFPIRVELDKLSKEDFIQILTDPKNSLTKQAQILLGVEGVRLEFLPDAIEEMANYAYRVNEETENIGARRLHTIMERLLEDISFEAAEMNEQDKNIRIDAAFVKERLGSVVENRDLSRYIL